MLYWWMESVQSYTVILARAMESIKIKKAWNYNRLPKEYDGCWKPDSVVEEGLKNLILHTYTKP